MMRHALSLATMLSVVGALTAACATMPGSTMSTSMSSGTMSVPDADVSVKMPAGSEFSNGPTTPGGLVKSGVPSAGEFSNGPSSGGGAKKGSMPSSGEFSNGPK